MSERLTQFGRRAFQLVNNHANGSAAPDDVTGASSSWRPRVLQSRPSSLAHLDRPDNNHDTVEETFLKEHTHDPESDTSSSQKPCARAISAIGGRARQRAAANAGWGTVRTLETSPTRVRGTDKITSKVTKETEEQSFDDIDNNDSNDLKHQKKCKSSMEGIESAVEHANSLQASGSITNSGPSGGSSWSSSVLSSGSTLSYLARPAMQALAALEEPDSTIELTAGWSGSGSSIGSSGRIGTSTSLDDREEVDVELLAAASLSGSSVVMSEMDTIWMWSGMMMDVAPLLTMRKGSTSVRMGE